MYNNKDIEWGRRVVKKRVHVFLVCLIALSFCSACSDKEEKPNFDDEKEWSGFY